MIISRNASLLMENRVQRQCRYAPAWTVRRWQFAFALLISGSIALAFVAGPPPQLSAGDPDRLRVIIETDAGGDPDDEQSLVRFLLYTNEWDVEGIIPNRPHARDGENKNSQRTGLAIVRRQLAAYGDCHENLVKHDARFPSQEQLWRHTVPGYNDTSAAVELIMAAVDRDDPRPVWYCDWGTDHGAATNNLRRALDRVLHERGPQGYANFKGRLRLASADAFGEHTDTLEPPFPLWVDTFRPELEGKRWYHRFSALTATAGGFDIERDVRTGHGRLGALYPLNTTHRQKEGDSMCFLYLIPTGMNDPQQPGWGSWGGRYGLNPGFPGRAYYWANQFDRLGAKSSRDYTLARWADALQHDFAARLDWCVADGFDKANHRPIAVLNGDRTQQIARLTVQAGTAIELSSAGSSDPDGQPFDTTWFTYPEAGTVPQEVQLSATTGETTRLIAPRVKQVETVHVVLQLQDHGNPRLFAFRRAVIAIEP